MSVVEHQMLNYEKVISYTTTVELVKIPDLIKGIINNTDALGLQVCGKVIVAIKEDGYEFIIPVDKEICGCGSYEYKPQFKLTNALRMRHCGPFVNICDSLTELNKVIHARKLCAITEPYVVAYDIDLSVYDIYIGISENIL